MLKCFQGHGDIAADVVAAFLPGVVSSIVKILIGDSKQGTKVFIAALEVFTTVLTLCLSDQVSEKIVDNPVTTASENMHLVSFLKKIEAQESGSTLDERKELSEIETFRANENPNTIRSRKWFEETKDRIAKYVRHLFRTSRYDIASMNGAEELKLNPSAFIPVEKLNWDFRMHQAQTCFRLLSTCSIAMSDCSKYLFDTLVCLTEDDHETVASGAGSLFERLPLDHFLSQFRDSLRLKIAALPRVLQSETQVFKLQVIKLVCGLLRLRLRDESEFQKQLLTKGSLEQIAHTLYQCLELNLSDSRVMEKSSGSLDYFQECRFERIREHDVKQYFLQMIDLLSVLICKENSIQYMIDILLQRIRSGLMSTRCEALIFMERVVSAAFNYLDRSGEDLDFLKDWMLIVLEDLISGDVWNAHKMELETDDVLDSDGFEPQLGDVSNDDGNLMLESRRRAMLVLLAISVMGQKDHFPLVHYLYPLLEKLGDSNLDISNAAKCSLLEICVALGYANIEHLVISNADYFVDALSFKLKYSSEDVSSSLMLQELLKQSSTFEPELIPLLRDLLKDVMQALDWSVSDESRMVSYLRSLTAIVNYTARDPTLVPKVEFEFADEKSSDYGYSLEDMARRILTKLEELDHESRLPEENEVGDFVPPHLYNKKKCDETKEDETFGEEDEEVGRDNNMEAIRREEEAEKPTDDELLISGALKKCQNFLGSDNMTIRYIALDAFCNGLPLISHKDNVLLPLIAQMWEPLKSQFNFVSQRELFKKTFDLVELMGSLASKFLSRRLNSELWPTMKNVLREVNREVEKEGLWKKSQFESTLEFQILKKILSFLLKSATWPDATWNLKDVTRAILPIVMTDHNSSLRNLSIAVLERFCLVDADLIWSEVYCYKGKSEHIFQLIQHIDNLTERPLEFFGQVF
eukprot:TRINITY_DN11138_c0_g1_i11.p1 TRINITY_DN11138_c0_g1~~TRINITY_DN11138_c0_g1_i11.p1  ORF type:complete len:922 (-),score=265.25 TRINITY_DN11138_c0_g1_i11:53-2818(-)